MMARLRLSFRAPWWARPYLAALCVAYELGFAVDLDAAAARIVRHGVFVEEA